MEICKPNSEMSMEEVVIGNTTYVVKTNRICKENG